MHYGRTPVMCKRYIEVVKIFDVYIVLYIKSTVYIPYTSTLYIPSQSHIKDRKSPVFSELWSIANHNSLLVCDYKNNKFLCHRWAPNVCSLSNLLTSLPKESSCYSYSFIVLTLSQYILKRVCFYSKIKTHKCIQNSLLVYISCVI